ncbi:MAG: hypothetical protein KME10_17235 [Plectolyngbya sp. WJT66-NPBG17]|jgi:hypothetical protein|nr:hypothetical protein [Plectolyngbya sp. WJT66-NPBG17]MBW4526029.1 hypothetical protein [Phormidium tanganyikae FI6-MK23]
MTLQELEQQVHQLSVAERLSLLNTITRSLQQEIDPPSKSTPQEKLAIVNQMRGFLARPGEPAPTDEEVEAVLDQRRVEKYLQ